MNHFKKISLGILLLAVCAFKVDEHRKKRLYLIGDSTMSVKETKAYPETGWGMPFAYFFDSSLVVDNRAKNGRSTRTFLSEGLWQPVVDALQAGDFVFIQFGHNDEVKEKTDRYATPDEFRTNLDRFISDAKGKGALPVLLTPVSRRKFDKSGNAVETHEIYAPIVRELASAAHVPMIDLDAQSLKLYQQLGEQNSKLLFNQLDSGEHPNYPSGKLDNTHFNELGARRIAELVLQNIRHMNTGLEQYIVKRQPAADTRNYANKATN